MQEPEQFVSMELVFYSTPDIELDDLLDDLLEVADRYRVSYSTVITNKEEITQNPIYLYADKIYLNELLENPSWVMACVTEEDVMEKLAQMYELEYDYKNIDFKVLYKELGLNSEYNNPQTWENLHLEYSQYKYKE